MPKQTMSADDIIARMGREFVEAHEESKNKETEYSQFGDLPPGIEGGVARLVECKFDLYKKGANQGKPFFYAAGVVVSPKEAETFDSKGRPVGVMAVEGLRTSLTEALCNTSKTSPNSTRQTVKQHVDWVYNELRKLGVDTKDLSHKDLPATMAALVEAGPYFKFRTWRGAVSDKYPNPKTNHSWGGTVDFEGDDDAGLEDDQTAPPAGGNGAATAPAPVNRLKAAATPPAAGSKAKAAPPKAAPPKGAGAAKAAPPPAADFDDQGDLDTLAERAQAGDEEARGELTRLALQAGHDEDDVANADTWADVVKLIEAGGEGGGEADEGEAEDEEAEEFSPAVGEVYRYHPIDPKTKKPLKSSVEIEVTAVNEQARTADLKNLDNPKVAYKRVPFDSLTPA